MSLPHGRTALALLGACAFPACFPPTDGREPPLDRIYFPVGLALGGAEEGAADGGAPEAARFLYVASSDFDLQFNAGSLQAYDLSRLSDFLPRYCESDDDCTGGHVCDGLGSRTNDGDPSYWCVDPSEPRPCGGLGEKPIADRQLAPGRCDFLDPVAPPSGDRVLAQSVGIGAFVTDILRRPCPAANPACSGSGAPSGRLFMPVRGDATLHWIDEHASSDGPGLDCGQRSGSSECDVEHRRGESEADNVRDLTLASEPFGIGADAAGEVVLVTHQVDGQVSLFVNDWDLGVSGGPRLEFVLAGLPSGAVAIASLPEARFIDVANTLEEVPDIDHEPGFLVTFRNSPEVRLVRYFDDSYYAEEFPDNEGRPFLDGSRGAEITTNSEGFNSRGVAVDDRARASCEAACDPTDVNCFRQCAGIPLDVFVANRSPATLVLGRTAPNSSASTTDDIPWFSSNVPMAAGASRVVLGDVRGADGTPQRRVFVVCFDSRKVFVYDPAAARIEAVIETGRGPQAFAVDTARGLGFVAHFTDSYVGVVDLDMSHTQRYGEIVLTLGPPTPPRASK